MRHRDIADRLKIEDATFQNTKYIRNHVVIFNLLVDPLNNTPTKKYYILYLKSVSPWYHIQVADIGEGKDRTDPTFWRPSSQGPSQYH